MTAMSQVMPQTQTSQPLRLAGVPLILCGALTAVFWLVHPSAADPKAAHDAAFWAAMQSARYQGANASFVFILVMSMFGLIGLYAKQAAKVGVAGLAGFGLGFTGTALFVAAGVFQAFVAPVLAASEATRPLLEESGPLLGGPLAGVFAGGGLLFGLGYVVFGVATFRAGVLPRWAALLLVVSSPILGLSPLMPLVARTLGSAVFGVANVWLGLAMLRRGR